MIVSSIWIIYSPKQGSKNHKLVNPFPKWEFNNPKWANATSWHTIILNRYMTRYMMAEKCRQSMIKFWANPIRWPLSIISELFRTPKLGAQKRLRVGNHLRNVTDLATNNVKETKSGYDRPSTIADLVTNNMLLKFGNR